MADKDNRIGFIDETGAAHYPEVTISGQPYERPYVTHSIGGNQFVVGDIFTPPGFDLSAELDTLRAAAKKSAKPAPEKL